MSIDYYSESGIGIVIREDEERFSELMKACLAQFKEEAGIEDDDDEDVDFLDGFEDFVEEQGIHCVHGGNLLTGNDGMYMFVCSGETLQEQIDDIPNFLETMNKYILVTKEELNIVSVYQVM